MCQAIAKVAIAGAKAVQRMWTQIMKDESAETRSRLWASEPLAKALGMFVKRREVKAEIPQITGFEVVLEEMEKRADAGPG